METSDSSVAIKDENGHVSWINHGLVKAFVAGSILAIGTSIAGLLNWMLKIPDWPTINGFSIFYVSQIFLLITCIYLTLHWANKLLQKFGFEGVMVHQNEKLDFPKLFGAASGCLMAYFLTAVVGIFGILLMTIGSNYMGMAKFKILIAAIIVGAAAFFALARRVSHNQAKAEQETQ